MRKKTLGQPGWKTLLVGGALTVACASAAHAQPNPLAGLSDYEAGGYVFIDPLNIMLLQNKAGAGMDSARLMGGMVDSLFGASRSRFDLYAQAQGNVARFEAKQVLDDDLRERMAGLARAKGYLFPMGVAAIGAFDAQANSLSMRLTMDLNRVSGNRAFQCASSRRDGGAPLVACLSATNFDDRDPVFSQFPTGNAQAADQIRPLIQEGRLALYAVASPDGAYQSGSGIPAGVGGGNVAGSQPVRILALLLADAASGRVLNAGKTSGTPEMPQLAKPGANPAGTSAPAVPAPAPTPAPVAGAHAPDADSPVPPAGADVQRSDVRYGPPAEGQILDLDRLLSLLSLTVYVSPERVKAASIELEALQAKFDRISQDVARVDVIQQKELQKLATTIERKQRKLALLQELASLKETIPSYGARRMPGPRYPKVNYERYHLRDGKDVIVFRGTDDARDLETDFQLAMTPEAIAEVAAKVGTGQSLVSGVANLMRNQAAPDMEGRPEAFKSADALVSSLIRSGVRSKNLLLTGHSLGGGLAQYAGLKNQVGTIVTFNTAPLNAQLQSDVAKGEAEFNGLLRHYVSFVPGPTGSGQGTMDPVSQRLSDVTGLTEFRALQVVGPQRVIEVCNDLDSPEYQSFYETAQGYITKGTVALMASGRKSLIKTGKRLGAAAGENASTDQKSSVSTGSDMGVSGAKALAVGLNCYKHPFLCSAKLAAGGLASAYASAVLPKMWTMYSAHRMKNLYEAINSHTPGACSGTAATY